VLWKRASTVSLHSTEKVPSTRVSLVQFDGNNPYEVVYSEMPIQDVPKFRLEPRGSTPLCDCLVKTIDETGKRYARTPEGARPQNVLFVVITDGQENASRVHNKYDVQRRIERQSKEYNWEFLYLGANQDAFKEAESIGIPMASAIAYTASVGDTRAKMNYLASNTLRYVKSGNRNDLEWFEQQREDKTGAS